MDKDIARIVKRNTDVIDFIREMLVEEPDLSTQEIKDRVYKEFTYGRFAKQSIIVQLLITKARENDGKEKESNKGI